MKPKRRIISFLLAICLVAGLMPTAAFAAGTDTGKAIQLGTSGISGYDSTNGYDYIYYSTWEGTPIKWRVLDDQTNTEKSGLFLLSDALLGTGSSGDVYFNRNKSNAWQGSTAREWCETFYNGKFSEGEKGAVLATTKSDGAYTSIGTDRVEYAATENILNGDKVFFLSAEEAENSAYGFTDNNARIANYNNSAHVWWLRSAYPPSTTGSPTAGTVYGDGRVGGYSVYFAPDHDYRAWAARPAFNLDLKSVLFTSAAEGGKAADAISEIGGYAGNEWKLTLLDRSRQFGVTVDTASGKPGDTITLNYTGATIGANEYISVIIADGSGAQYYGRVAQTNNNNNASGQINIKIPTSLAGGTYTLNVFSEQYNGGENDDTKLTDYASAFEAVTLNVSSDTTAPTLTGGSATRTSETAATVKFTSNEAGSYYYTVVESGAAEPGVNSSGMGTACDTTEQTISLTTLTAGAKDIYIVVKDAAGNISDKLKIEIPAYVAPSYGISAGPSTLDFGRATEGYSSAPAAQTVTITNTGNQTINLNQPTATDFNIGTLSTTDLAAGGTATFTVQPKTGLAARSHSETLTISGSNGTSASVTLAFQVDPKQYLVTVNGSYASTTGAGEYALGATVNIFAGSRSNYSFNGWTSDDVTIDNASSKNASFVMPEKNVTVTAQWTANGTTTPTVNASSGIDVWYNGGNSFGTSKSAVPTAVEIDGVPVSFTGNGSEFTVGCISPNAKRVTVNWNSTSVTTNFTPDANAYCTQVQIPKTGDMPFWTAIAEFFGF